jgi:hypothetical protein
MWQNISTCHFADLMQLISKDRSQKENNFQSFVLQNIGRHLESDKNHSSTKLKIKNTTQKYSKTSFSLF